MRIWKYLKLSEIINEIKKNKEENFSQEEQENQNNNQQDENQNEQQDHIQEQSQGEQQVQLQNQNQAEQQEQSNDEDNNKELNKNESQKNSNSNSQANQKSNSHSQEQSNSENNDLNESNNSDDITDENQENFNQNLPSRIESNKNQEQSNEGVQTNSENKEISGEETSLDLNKQNSQNIENEENSSQEQRENQSNDLLQNNSSSSESNDFQENSSLSNNEETNLKTKTEYEESDFEENNNQQNKSQSEQQEQKPQSKESDEKLNDDSDIETTSENNNDELDETSDLKKRKELLQKLRDKLEEYKEKKQESEQQQNENIKNNFLESLKDLPSFEDRSKGNGYSINPEDEREVSEVIIKTLINKFLNQRFTKKQSDLNVRSNSLEKSNGFYKWEIKDVITHLETEQYTKVLSDKYGYDYSHGNDENVPLSFYFDMSGSMSGYSSLLAIIAIELLKKKVKVLVGFNENVHIQIESIDKNISISELITILENAGSYDFTGSDKIERKNKVTYKLINKDIDKYLIEKKAEKAVVFADFDPITSVIHLSNYADVYYFCFERNISKYKLSGFKGFVYPVQNEIDLERGLVKVNEKKFKSLVYLDNPEVVKRR